MEKAIRVIVSVLMHCVAALFLLLGVAGQIKGMRWAPIDSDGNRIEDIRPLVPEAFVSWGLAVIVLFWMFANAGGGTRQPAERERRTDA